MFPPTIFKNHNSTYLPTPFALEINTMTTEVQGALDGVYIIGFLYAAFALNLMSNLCAMYAFFTNLGTALAGGSWRSPLISSYETCYGQWSSLL